MIRIITARRQLRVVSKDLSNFENSGGRSPISFLLSKTWLVLPRHTRAPSQPVLSKQHRKRSSHSSDAITKGRKIGIGTSKTGRTFRQFRRFLPLLYRPEDTSHRLAKPSRTGRSSPTQTEMPRAYWHGRQCSPATRTLAHRPARE